MNTIIFELALLYYKFCERNAKNLKDGKHTSKYIVACDVSSFRKYSNDNSSRSGEMRSEAGGMVDVIEVSCGLQGYLS